MSFFNDLKFIGKNTSRIFNNLPSKNTRKARDQALVQSGFSRGVDHGAKRATMYYPGAANGTMQGDWSTGINSSISVVRRDIKNLWGRSEALYRSAAIARRGANILTQYIVGQGNRPYPAIRDEKGEPIDALNDQLSRDWERFNDQSIRNGTQELTDYQAQALDFVTMIVYGTVLNNQVSSKKGSLLPYAFQTLKPYRLDFSKDTMFGGNYEEIPEKFVVHGIEMNQFGEPIKFNFDNGKSYSSDRMNMTFFPLETEQYLGLPWMTPVLPQIWDHQQLFDDKIKTSRIGAKLGIHFGANDASGIAALLRPDGSVDANGNMGSTLELDYQGIIMTKDKPEAIAITDPISDTFEPIIRMLMQYVSIGFGFSYQLFTSDLSGANFSSARMNKLTDNSYFSTLYKWYIKARCQKRWEQFVKWEVMTGRLSSAGCSMSDYQKDPWFYNQAFHLPLGSEGYVDPLKDMNSLKLAYKLGQISYLDICAYNGKHYRSVMKQLERERKELTAAGLTYLLPENVENVAQIPNVESQIEQMQEVNK